MERRVRAKKGRKSFMMTPVCLRGEEIICNACFQRFSGGLDQVLSQKLPVLEFPEAFFGRFRRFVSGSRRFCRIFMKAAGSRSGK
jgi:hypothetical protein